MTVTCAHCGAVLDPAHRARPWTPEVPMYCHGAKCRQAEKYRRRRAAAQCVRCGRPAATRSRCARCRAWDRYLRRLELPAESPLAIRARYQTALATIRARSHVGDAAWAVRGGIATTHTVRTPKWRE